MSYNRDMKCCRIWNVCTRAIFVTLLTGSGQIRAQAPEPTYTLVLPGKQTVHLQIQARTGLRGPQIARIFNTPVSPLATDKSKKSDFILDASIVKDPNGIPTLARLSFGADNTSLIAFEGRRMPDGVFRVSIPEERKTLPFGAPLVTNLTAQIFLGRLYQWEKGGEQNFALLVDYGWKPIEITTLKLTANGKETITLADGKFEARKLRFEASVPHLGATPQKGDLYIGPLGEILRCDSPLFGLPFRLRGPAKREEGKRIIAQIFLPTDRLTASIKAERTNDRYDVTLYLNENVVSSARAGLDYQATHFESSSRGRPFIANIYGNQLQYILSEAAPEDQTYDTGRPWFAPYWLVTALWENDNASFGGMSPGEKRKGEAPQKIAGLLQDNSFTLERLTDTTAEIGNSTFPVRHYRMTAEKSITDLYTDGSRLIASLNSDGMTITRDGWETWAAAQDPPKKPVK